MPEMNGLRLLQHLNEQQKKQSMPVVLLSGCITGELRDAALKAGATAVLKKPWHLGELISEVNRILEHR
jgi:DNA-binding response OmpR family regulator